MKKIIKFSTIAWLMAVTTVFASGIIDQQIQTIEHAPLQQRVKLMNQFKIKLRHMNQQDRAKAIGILRANMQNSHTNQGMANKGQNFPQNVQQMRQVSGTMQTNVQQRLNQQQGFHQYNNMKFQGGQKTPIQIPMH